MKVSQSNISETVERVLKDRALQRNLTHSLSVTNKKRLKAVANSQDWDVRRRMASQIRSSIVDTLDNQLLTFSNNAEKNELKVHWACDGSEAREIIIKLLKLHGVKKVVKSKSMLTEEIDLNKSLIESGIEPIETDLGEFIAQIAGQRPSHITAPIIHLSRQDVAAIMNEKLGVPYSEDPKELTAAARKHLRSEFLTADAGISGVNFGLVNEGSIVIVENEGNARLSLSLPRIHIAVMGIERLLPSINDLPLFLPLLTVSATGQHITNYVSIIKSPKLPEEIDGPDEVHIVMVDNGRSDILGNKNVRTILKCIRCGACMNVCPVYGRIGGHTYNSVYPGPMGAILSPLLFSIKKYKDLPYMSTLCGKCDEVCPVEIPLHELLLELRSTIVRKHLRPLNERLLFSLFSRISSHPILYRFLELIIRNIPPFYKMNQYSINIPRWSLTRDFPLFPSRSYIRKRKLEMKERDKRK